MVDLTSLFTDTLKARTVFKAFAGVDAENGEGQFCLQFMEDRFSRTGRKTMNDALDNTTDRVSFALDALNQSRESIRVRFLAYLDEFSLNGNSFGR